MTVQSNDSFFTTIRTQFAARAAQRQDRLALQRDLAEFRSERDIAELDMILARNPGAEADQIRRVHSAVLATSGARHL